MTDDQYAGIGARVLAYLIDSGILVMIGIVVGIGAQVLPPGRTALILQVGIMAAVTFGYFTYLEGRTGQTVGKQVMDITVVTETDAPMTYTAAAIRNLLRAVDGMVFYIVGIVIIALSEDDQRIGDMIASTLVVPTDEQA